MSSHSIHGRNPLTGKFIEVRIQNGIISSVRSKASRDDLWLSPGWIDLQVNGYAGFDLNAESIEPDLVHALARRLLSLGVTTFVPTIITASEDRIIAALMAIREARKQSPLTQHVIPFVHLEGPHISAIDDAHGAHPRGFVRPPDILEFERWQTESNGLVCMVTLSPHWGSALPYIERLASRGCYVAIGHTNADPGCIHEAAAAGARISTHLGNGVSRDLPRHPNLLWAQLADDRLMASFIADGQHLPADTLKAMLCAKGDGRSILVSDVTSLGEMPPGTYKTPIGGTVELTADGRIAILGTQILAGAALPLKSGIANVSRLPGFSLGDAVRMVTENPGCLIGGRGVLRVGAEADLVQFRWNENSGEIEIIQTLVCGEAI